MRDEVVDMFYDFTRDENHSILISSHIVSDLERLCDYVAFLHKGKLLLCEEKDELLSEYGIIHCTVEQLSALDKSSVKYKKETPYGAEVIVSRKDAPDGFKLSPISIEESNTIYTNNKNYRLFFFKIICCLFNSHLLFYTGYQKFFTF